MVLYRVLHSQVVVNCGILITLFNYFVSYQPNASLPPLAHYFLRSGDRMYDRHYFLAAFYEETLHCDIPGTSLVVMIAFPASEDVLCQGDKKR